MAVNVLKVLTDSLVWHIVTMTCYFKYELLNRLRSTMAVNVLKVLRDSLVWHIVTMTCYFKYELLID